MNFNTRNRRLYTCDECHRRAYFSHREETRAARLRCPGCGSARLTVSAAGARRQAGEQDARRELVAAQRSRARGWAEEEVEVSDPVAAVREALDTLVKRADLYPPMLSPSERVCAVLEADRCAAPADALACPHAGPVALWLCAATGLRGVPYQHEPYLLVGETRVIVFGPRTVAGKRAPALVEMPAAVVEAVAMIANRKVRGLVRTEAA